ncbi:MAG TPA: Hpt domain-containing protein, partial [Polyangiaceae bacterium LLY-WYZ-14_1]|nr:Hpt domain-containing protein [Polyangiaceae bacterium LLY-WYZ-14_1]
MASATAPEGPPPDGDDPLGRHLRAMSARFERGLLERAAHLRRTAAAWEAGEESGREGLRVAAHRLKGIAGSCGHPDLGAWAAQVEEAAKASERPRGVEEARALAAEADRRGAVAVARDG